MSVIDGCRRFARVAFVAALALGLTVTGPSERANAATPWYEADFRDGLPSELTGSWGWSPTSRGHVGNGLRTRMPKGEHWGASGHVNLADIGHRGAETMYWRYWLRLDPDFYIEPPNRGKLPGPAGLYTYNCLGGRPSTVAEPCWSARTMFSRTYPSTGEPGYPDGPDDRTRLGSYVYHLDSPSHRGDLWSWDADTATLEHGRWYCVEGLVSLNRPGSADGVLRNWVDGRQAFERTGMRFRRAGEHNIDVKSFWMDVYHGGGPSAADNLVDVDSLALGGSRIGCDDRSRSGTFVDDDGSVHEASIEWLAGAEITRGCNPPTNDRFCPRRDVTRGQMAAFLVRALDLPASTRDRFVDDDGSVFEADIQALAERGITVGCNPPTNDRFCPGEPVSRSQMAAFLQRAYGLAAAPGDRFVDDDGSVFESSIQSLAAAGVTVGCNPPRNDRFCPGVAVTREQMATFLLRARTL